MRRAAAVHSITFGHEEEAVLGQRRVGQHLVDDPAVGDDVVAHRQAHRNDRRHRLDALDVDRLERLDELQNRVDLVLQMRRLRFAHADAREMRDTANGG